MEPCAGADRSRRRSRTSCHAHNTSMRSSAFCSSPMLWTVAPPKRAHRPVAAASDAGSSWPDRRAARRLPRSPPPSPRNPGQSRRVARTSASWAAGWPASRARTRFGSGASSRRSTRHPSRAGGRCWSLRQAFPGQVVERGGELIDNLHKTMLGYAQRFGLAREDVNKRPGEVFYVFGGERYPEAAVVDEFRAFVAGDAHGPATPLRASPRR